MEKGRAKAEEAATREEVAHQHRLHALRHVPADHQERAIDGPRATCQLLFADAVDRVPGYQKPSHIKQNSPVGDQWNQCLHVFYEEAKTKRHESR